MYDDKLLMPVVISWFIHIYDDKDSGLVTEYNMVKSNEILTLQSLGCSFRSHSFIFESIKCFKNFFQWKLASVALSFGYFTFLESRYKNTFNLPLCSQGEYKEGPVRSYRFQVTNIAI